MTSSIIRRRLRSLDTKHADHHSGAKQPSVRPTFTRHVKRVIESMTAPFARAKKRNARRLAIQQASSMVDAIILAHAVDDPQLSEEILREVRATLS